jgi:large subunit ribosomal protein L15
MKQNELKPAPGSKHVKKRVGRGDASGHGTFAGRGLKGQKSRSGPDIPRGFEGGQLPIIKRLPGKRGFVNIFRTEFSVVNVGQLQSFPSNSTVTAEILVKARLIKNLKFPVKLLADGDIKLPLTIKLNKVSKSAKTKIEAAGGKVEEI